MVWLGFGSLLDLRSVFRNGLVSRSPVNASFANNIIRKLVKDKFTLWQKRALLGTLTSSLIRLETYI